MKSPSQHEQYFHADMANELRALKAQEAKLGKDLAVEERKRQSCLYRLRFNKLGLCDSCKTPKVVQTEKSPIPHVQAMNQEVTVKDLSKNEDLDEALEFLKGSHLDFVNSQPSQSTQYLTSQKTQLKASKI